MTCAWVFAGAIASTAARASVIDLGYVSFDVTSAGVGQFDIFNGTGPNQAQLGSPDFPVTNTVDFTNLQLVVDFSNGTKHTYGASYFTTSSDGISFDGTPIPFGGTNPKITGADLTGDYSTELFKLASGGTFDANSAAFNADITAVSGALVDGDDALLTATSGSAAVPEPATWALLAGGLLMLLLARQRGVGAGVVALLATLSLQAQAAPSPVGLGTATLPSSGAAGFSYVNLTAYNLSSVSASAITVTIAPTCAAGATSPVAGELTTAATSITSLPGGAGERIQFLIPAKAKKGTYFASVSGNAAGGSFASPACAVLVVSSTPTQLKACLPTSSLAVAVGNGVTAYVPNGAWYTGGTGINVVPIEGSGTATTVATPGVVNSCSSNPATGQTVCTANSTDIYLLKGMSLTNTLTSGATGTANYSGGFCQNCGVAINALTGTAYIAEGSNTSPAGTQLQRLDLLTTTLAAPFVTQFQLSEDISVDPSRNLILSASYGPSENDPSYQLYTLDTSGNVVKEYSNAIPSDSYPDSAAEDCSTGIGVASSEDGNGIYLANVAQATFNGSTWSAPSQYEELQNTTPFSAGICGISVAPGTTHLGVLSGEFGGSSFAAFLMPSKTTSEAPALVDYVSANLPATPDGFSFSAGYDPHTITAYTSPTNGRAYGVIADWGNGGNPTYLAIIDLAAALAAKRTSGTAIIDPSVDLLASGIVRYVPVP